MPQGGSRSHIHKDRVTDLDLDADGSLNILSADSVIRERSVQESVHSARLEGGLKGDKSKIHLALVSAGCELHSNRYVTTGGLMSHECAAGVVGVSSRIISSCQNSAMRAVSDNSASNSECDTDTGSTGYVKDVEIG